MPNSNLRNIDARRICLIKPSALGDVVQTLSLLPMLRERFPEAKVSWVINRELGPLLEGHPDLDEVVPFDRHGSWRSFGRLLTWLRREKFDLVLDMQGLFRTGLMTLATGAQVRIGLETGREGANLFCTHVIFDSGKSVPAHRRYWRVAEALGMGELRQSASVARAAEDYEWVQQMREALRGPILAIHPGARWRTKKWPIAKFTEVARRARERYGFSVAVVGSPAEAAACEELAETLRSDSVDAGVVNLAGRTSLKQLAALLSQVQLLLSNDSGPMHLAAGLGTPVVSIFTCTSPVRSGPGGKGHVLIASDLPCAASYCKSCPKRGAEHMACMDEITVDRVWSDFVRIVEARRLFEQPALPTQDYPIARPA